ncbi:hypothetical protein [Novosphingobium cyanobacteriorum]|uniref:Lipoprotein n=1 Tax=Novosphingobium cyanobacteriorum TaxID=3024215 RepID=A0ABT6CIC5_9SPHN|nr:hypothetical protein [Novosphingobium cyanobacteriorum]MDF8333674.1 hypothetical protein [Novosphingobium cyanobacteriorum]
MRVLLALLGSLLLAAGTPPDEIAGTYRLEGMPDAAGELQLRADGRFAYILAYGALDERAEGSWLRRDRQVDLTTQPKPVAPVFRLVSSSARTPGSPMVQVTWPNGRGIAGVDILVGFGAGEPIAGYTQEQGWGLPAEERRTPRWIELSEPVYHLESPRFPLDCSDPCAIRVVLVPNDLGVIDFTGIAVDLLPNELRMHRGASELRFVRQAASP